MKSKKKNTLVLIVGLALFVVVLGSSLVNAANRYIRVGATGNSTGTDWVNAWPSFQTVIWNRGDIYYVASGEYEEDVAVQKSELNNQWIEIRKATLADHGTDVGWQNVYAQGTADIKGRLSLRNSYIKFDGRAGKTNSGHGFRVLNQTVGGRVVEFEWGKSHLHLLHTEVKGTGLSGTVPAGNTQENGLYIISDTPRDDIYVGYCWIHNVNRDGVVLGGHGGTSGLIFEHNRIENTGGHADPDAHGQGIQFAITTTNSKITIRYNQFVDIQGSANISFLGGTTNNDVNIYGNFFWSTNPQKTSSPGVIWIRSGTPAVTAQNFSIYNNTFHQVALAQVANDAMVSDQVFVRNNIFEECGFSGVGHRGVTADHNLYFNNYSFKYADVNDRGSPATITMGSTDVVALNSSFVSAIQRDYRLRSDSLAIDRGLDVGAVYASDTNGTSRPQGLAWDIGAYESTQEPNTLFHVRQDGFGDFTTIQSCVDVAQPGEVCLVYAGTYAERPISKRPGTAANPIVIRAQNPAVTLRSPGINLAATSAPTSKLQGFTVKHDYIVIEGFDISNSLGCYNDGIKIDGNNVEARNNYIHDSPGIVAFTVNGNSGLVRENKVYKTNKGFNIFKSSNVIEYNDVSRMLYSCQDADFIRAFGVGHIIRLNYFHDNVASEVPYEFTHPDLIQTFGNNGATAMNIIFEKNFMFNLAATQIGNITQDQSATIRDWTFRHNVFVNVGAQINVYMPGVLFANNSFKNVRPDSIVLIFNSGTTAGRADRGQALSNFFIDSGVDRRNSLYAFSATLVGTKGDYNYIVGTPPTWSKKNNWTDAVEPNGLNGGDPRVQDVSLVLGADGIPFTLDDGLKPLKISSMCARGENGVDIGAYSCDSDKVFPADSPINPRPSAPVIISQPGNQSIMVGQTAVFSISATGSAPLSYRWFKNGSVIAGEASASYTTPTVVMGNTGTQFYCEVKNSAGAVTSSSATLTVTESSTPIPPNDPTPPENPNNPPNNNSNKSSGTRFYAFKNVMRNNETLEIQYYLEERGPVTVKLRNRQGEILRAFDEGEKLAGDGTLFWDGRNGKGEKVASGTYRLELMINGKIIHTKVVIIK